MSAKDIIALINGHPGPFLEDETSFFGAKYANPDVKSDKMQTDCGGLLITKSKLTYGDADRIADAVDLDDLYRFITGPETPKWDTYDSQFSGVIRSPYFKDWVDDHCVFFGIMQVVVYRYLVSRKLIEGKSDSYCNSAEYLYDRILDRLFQAGKVRQTVDGRWFDLLAEVRA